MLLQNQSFATYGTADDLTADCETIRRYAGKSALSALDSISIQFLRGAQWTTSEHGNKSKHLNGSFAAVSVHCVVSSSR